MAKFMGLMKNEYIKLLKKTSTLVLMIILAAYCFIIPVFSMFAESTAEEFSSSSESEYSDWKGELEAKLEYVEMAIEDYERMAISAADEESKKEYLQEADELKEWTLIYEYRLENDIEFDVSDNTDWFYSEEFNFWSVFNMTSGSVGFITIIVIVAAGSIIASEFSKGTIKFLLINPVKRWKILLSKYLTVISFGYASIILTYILSFIITIIFFGGDNLTASYIYVSGGEVASCPGLLYTFGQYMLSSVNMVVSGTLAFAISALFRSSALSISISIVGSLMGSTVTSIFSALGYNWGKYIIFANTSIPMVLEGQTGFENHTLTIAVAVIAVHLAIFLFAAFKSFTKRQV